MSEKDLDRKPTAVLPRTDELMEETLAGELFANAAAETRPEKRALLQALADHYTAIAGESRRHTATET